MGYPKIPDITCDDIAKIYEEEDKWRKENPCCENCHDYYIYRKWDRILQET